MYRISRKFRFAAAHKIDSLPDGHKAGRMHAHHYTVELILKASALSLPGFIVDYESLDAFKKYLEQDLEHQVLNDVLGYTLGASTTAECLARHFFKIASGWWPELAAVRVAETEDTWAEYSE